ncbi:MAG TPA: hypothetical protein VHJ20_16070 [Polyangia bacterium]|nr:hypothetical protein [Polyangia bacterium]
MRRLLWAIPIAAFFLNPSLACGPAGPSYEYGAQEMRDAVTGTWSLTFTPDGGTQTRVSFLVEQASAPEGQTPSAAREGRSLVRAAHACGTRTLVASAAACVDITDMPLEVTFLSGDDTFKTAALSGTFRVVGTRFFSGDVELVLGPYHVTSQISAFGTLSNTNLSAPGPGGAITVVTREPAI